MLSGTQFRPSSNDYDWLGPGVYFWEANPLRGLQFAQESAARRDSSISEPFVVGAVIEMGLCLDLTTSAGLDWVRIAYHSLAGVANAAGFVMPTNSSDALRRHLDCAVIHRLHTIRESEKLEPIDTVKGVFTEGGPLYPGAGFLEKTHIQLAVCNPRCIKGVFRVPDELVRR